MGEQETPEAPAPEPNEPPPAPPPLQVDPGSMTLVVKGSKPPPSPDGHIELTETRKSQD